MSTSKVTNGGAIRLMPRQMNCFRVVGDFLGRAGSFSFCVFIETLPCTNWRLVMLEKHSAHAPVARAMATTVISAGFARRICLANASAVAPLVNTSSTIKTCLPVSICVCLIVKAPRTFSFLSASESMPCLPVLRVLLTIRVATGQLVCLLSI